MKKIALTLLTVLGSQLAFSQITKNVGDYTKLKVYDKIPVELIKSNKDVVEIEGEYENDVELINKNGDLKIRMSTLNLLKGDKVKVKVYYKDLSDIQASQGAVINSNDKLKTDYLTLTSNEGSSIKLEVNTKKINVKLNSGGEIILKGKNDALDVVANSGGKFFSKNLSSSSANLTTNAGGEIETTVTDIVDAKTRAGGVIDIYGNPKTKTEKKFAGGRINFK